MLGGGAVLVGGLELLNTVMAAFAAGRGGGLAAGGILAAVIGLASALLLAAGIALLLRPRQSIGFARGAALAVLIVFAFTTALRPGFSMASMLLGILFPVVMLVVIARRGAAHTATLAR